MKFRNGYPFLLIFVILCCGCQKQDQQPKVRSPRTDDPAAIAKLLDAITIHKNDLDPGLAVSKEKLARVREASSRLQDMGSVVVPELLRMAIMIRSSRAHESLTGGNAYRIIVNIGRPAIPFIREANLRDFGEEMMREIEKKETAQQGAPADAATKRPGR